MATSLVTPVRSIVEKIQYIARKILEPLRHQFRWQRQGANVNLLAVKRDDVCDGARLEVRVRAAH